MKNIINLFGFIGLVATLCYIIFNRHGVVQNIALSNTLAEKQLLLSSLQTTKGKLDNEAKMLSNDSLDVDFLEEQARLLFNVIGKDEIQINIED